MQQLSILKKVSSCFFFQSKLQQLQGKKKKKVGKLKFEGGVALPDCTCSQQVISFSGLLYGVCLNLSHTMISSI